jgi:hypothetical protein
MKLLQINIDQVAASSKDEDVLAFAQLLSKVSGLRWKIWIGDEKRSEVGGIYLFDDQASAKAFIDGPLFAQVKSNPNFTNIQTKLFDINVAASEITRAPLQKAKEVAQLT